MDIIDVTDEDVYCDKTRLNQVLLNLLSNAIKFTSPGGTVSVRVAQLPNAPEGKGLYVIRIKDTGIGMSQEFSQRILSPSSGSTPLPSAKFKAPALKWQSLEHCEHDGRHHRGTYLTGQMYRVRDPSGAAAPVRASQCVKD